MKKEQGAKLVAYSSMAVAFLTVSSAEAQVYYTDLIPDESIGADLAQTEIYLDLNEDGIDDLRIFGINGGGSLVGYSAILAEGINPAGVNGCFVATSYFSSISDYGGAAVFDSSEVVDSSQYFASGTATVFRQNWNASGTSSTGVWAAGTNGALGIRLDIGGNSHLGWVKCSLVNSGEIVITDYMLNAQINTPLSVAEPPPPFCEPLSGLTATVLSPTQVKLDWNAVPNVERYQVRGRIPGAVFSTKSTTNNTLTVGVSPGVTYEWKVRAKCIGGEATGFSNTEFFTTPTVREEPVALLDSPQNTPKSQYITTGGQAAISDISIYTSRDALSINALDEPVLRLRLFDLNGKVVLQDNSTFQFKDYQLNDLPTGIYILSINRQHSQLSYKLIVE